MTATVSCLLLLTVDSQLDNLIVEYGFLLSIYSSWVSVMLRGRSVSVDHPHQPVSYTISILPLLLGSFITNSRGF